MTTDRNDQTEQANRAGTDDQTEPAPLIAHRVSYIEARHHFDAGGRVLVSERGHEATQPVHPDTTTHDRTTTTFDELVSQVNEWRHRYPNQRYYIVPGFDRNHWWGILNNAPDQADRDHAERVIRAMYRTGALRSDGAEVEPAEVESASTPDEIRAGAERYAAALSGDLFLAAIR